MADKTIEKEKLDIIHVLVEMQYTTYEKVLPKINIEPKSDQGFRAS
jgi:hypothetical protein